MVVKVARLPSRVGRFAQFLAEPSDEDSAYTALLRAESVGRPIDDPRWCRRRDEEASVQTKKH
jgi:hypothetical protein